MRTAPGNIHLAFALGGLLLTACSSSSPMGGDGGTPSTDCPSGLSKKTIGGVEYCVRSPTQNAEGYDEGNSTPTCGDPKAIDLSCFTTPQTAPATPATVTVEGYVDTFGLEKSTNGVTVEIRKLDGTLLGSTTATANHHCTRTKTGGSVKECTNDDPCRPTNRVCDTVQRRCVPTLAGYTIPDVPTNTAVVIKTSGTGFRNTHIFGRHFGTRKCQNPKIFAEATAACRSGEDAAGMSADCFIRDVSGTQTLVFRYDANIISDVTWNLIPLTAGYSRGIAPGNAAFAGQIHDCNNNRLRHAAVAVSPAAKGKLLTYFNGDCDNPTANVVELYTQRDSIYAVLDGQPGKVKMTAEAMSGGSIVTLATYEIELFANSVSLLTFGPPLPTVTP
jgi:hypothetical protein